MVKTLLVGAGKFGKRFYHHLIEQGYKVTTLSRTAKAWSSHHIEYDLSSNEPVGEDLSQYERVFFILAPSQRDEVSYRETYVDSISSFFENNQIAVNTHCTFLSAISVYGSEQLGVIDENTNPNPDNYRGEILLAAEENIKKLANKVTIVRASGLYSEDRQRLVQSLVAAENIDNPKWMNLIHEDDLCQWLDIASSQKWRLCIASDGQPFRRKDLTEVDVKIKDQDYRKILSIYLPKITLRYPSFRYWLNNQ